MKEKIQKIALAASLIIMAIALIIPWSDSKDKEIARLKQELAHAQQYVPLERDTVILHDRETVEVATSAVITAELKALRRQHIIDEQLIKDLGLKLKQLDAVQTTVTETKDTARAEYCHNIKVFSYDDRWSHLQFRLRDSTFYYNIRDSLATIVYHEYKHRFLWWRWGVKGYKVKILNFNPHSTIRYNTFVKPEK